MKAKVNGMKLHHGGPSKAQSFWAELDQAGGRISLAFGDGRTSEIVNNGGTSPIEMMVPSVDGRVMCCFLEGGGERFFATETGQQLVIAKAERPKGRVFKPEFYA